MPVQVLITRQDVTRAKVRELESYEALKSAYAALENANQAKTRFLNNMSHDIRTPMNAIIGFTALATTHITDTERVKDYLGKIMTSSNHLLSLINDVLDMSRIESGKIRLAEGECNLAETMHDLKNIIQSDINAGKLELFIDTVDVYDEDVYCDRLRLNQILLNLLSNAIKFTPAGGTVSVRIKESKAPAKGYGFYEFCIKDTGIGMSEEFKEHIFEPFEREANSTVSGIQGTGLGMSITKSIVDMMGGTITVTSERGKGTEFVVSLKLKLLSSAKTPEKIPQLEDCRALVVDDDFNTCDSVTNMLMQIGMRAEWTLSGKEAVLRTKQAVERNDDYRVYIIDWLMPDMNGIEVARQIRRLVGDNIPIIVLTAYDWSDIEQEARLAGVTEFCSKPMFMSELRKCLERACGIAPDEKEVEAACTIRFDGKRVLLAEDNALNREIASVILSEAGFSVDEAENGEVAVDKMRSAKSDYYDLVLMDIQMPVMDGYEATRQIRAMSDEKKSKVPIVAMTANAFREDKIMATQSGMNGHISKPIDIKVLLEELTNILSKAER
jgi:CheY-like chemotaxis protein